MADIQWDIKLKNLDEMMLYRKQLRAQLVEIIKTEAPITSGQLYKRVASIYGIGRVTQKLQGIVDTSLSRAPIFSKENNGNGRVYWTDIEQTKNYRSYRSESDREFADIPFVEMMNAMRYVASQQLSIERDDLKRLTAAEFGVTRLTAPINQLTEDAVSRHIKSGIIREEGSRVIYID